jgi:hypothetical protein
MSTKLHTNATTQAFTAWCAPLASMPSVATCAIPFVILVEGYEGNRPGRSDTLLPEVPRT